MEPQARRHDKLKPRIKFRQDRWRTTACKSLLIGLFFLAAALGLSAPVRAQGPEVNPWYRAGPSGEVEISLHFFWSETCPYCAEGKHYLEFMGAQRPWLVIESYEVTTSPANRQIFAEFAAALDEEILGVPAFFVCEQMIVGFDDATAELLASFVDYCHDLLAQDFPVAGPAQAPPAQSLPPEAPMAQAPPAPADQGPPAAAAPLPSLSLPLVGGGFDASKLSLPVLTVVLGGLDAFNPCAFFVLLFLLSLLVHAHSRGRVLLIGGVFVLFSGLLYFVFMAAWLHLFLVLEGIRAVTLTAGVIAVGLALFNIKDFLLGDGGARWGPSLSIPESSKPGLFARMRALLSAESLPAMLTGTVVLSVAANAYELLCSSGFPLVYTRALTLNDLSTAGYYLYLAFYNVIYVLPLLAIVAAVTFTLGRRKLSAAEGRALKLLSGLMMLGLGVVLILAPDLLYNWLTAVGLLLLAVGGTWISCRLDKRRDRRA